MARLPRGTEGSNPASSTGESIFRRSLPFRGGLVAVAPTDRIFKSQSLMVSQYHIHSGNGFDKPTRFQRSKSSPASLEGALFDRPGSWPWLPRDDAARLVDQPNARAGQRR